MERWHPVIDERGRIRDEYEVSSRGRVRTYLVPGRRDGRSARPRPKATFPDAGGLLNVTLRTSTGRSCFRHLVHTLVALAFLGPRPTRGHLAVHLNRNRQDNRPANLRWMTRPEASRHAMLVKPRRGVHARFTPAKVRAIRASKQTVRQIAAKHGVTVQAIYAIRKRHTWKDVA